MKKYRLRKSFGIRGINGYKRWMETKEIYMNSPKFGDVPEIPMRLLLSVTEEKLYYREWMILFLRYGIYGSGCTLQKLAQRFDISRDRVRQIEAIAIKKLQSNANEWFFLNPPKLKEE